MNRVLALCLTIAGVLALLVLPQNRSPAAEFSAHVDASGKIGLPVDFRNWTFLGTWAIAAEEEGGGAAGFHNVYTQPATVEAYRATGRVPDGAVPVKELLKARTGDYTTGRVSSATETEGWFVMVKDAKGRFPDNPLWGSGWGWSLFMAKDPGTTVTTDYEADCLGCHVPAKDNDWIYTEGYPALKK